MKRVCLVSSGTGGHLMPALVLAERLRERGHDALVMTEGRAVEQALLDRAGACPASLQIGSFGLTTPWRVLRATQLARRFLRQSSVDLVVCTGGRTSVPVALAARSLRRPVCLLEQNATTGRCNRFIAPFAQRIYLGLPQTWVAPRAIVTGTPLRREIGTIEREAARDELGLLHDVPVVLVMGGSQGARALNVVVPRGLAALERPLQVLHLSGAGEDAEVRLAYDAGHERGLVAIVRPLVRGIATWYAAADLVICRGGGCTVAELMVAGRPAIVVPYPHHKDRQQYWNGKVLEDAGAGIVLTQDLLTPRSIGEIVAGFLRRPHELEIMGNHAKALAPRDPCGAILDDLKNTVNLN